MEQIFPRTSMILALIIIFSSVLFPRPLQAASDNMPHEYSGSIKINGMAIDTYLNRLSEVAEILEVDLDKSTFDLHLKIEGYQARSSMGQSVRVDSSSQYRFLSVDPHLEDITIETGSRINFYLRLLRSADHEMEAIEVDTYTGEWKQSGVGRQTMFDLRFIDPDSDGDGLTNVEETILGLDFRIRDSDGDGLLDGEEVFLGSDGYVTNPQAYDSDHDGLSDSEEVFYGSDPWKTDTDSDNVSDYLEVTDLNGWITDPQNPDSDDDLLTDGQEIYGAGPPGQKQTSNPTKSDSDGDGLSDIEEVFEGDDGFITDVREPDTDGDGLTDGKEYSGSGLKSSITSNPLKADTDDDGIDDLEEVFPGKDSYVTDPRSDDSDDDGLTDSQEISGSGEQKLTSDPLKSDTDGDGLFDIEEVFPGKDNYVTDPSSQDTDKDSLSDNDEIFGNNDSRFLSDPTKQDTDSDGISDYLELNHPAGFISDPSKSDTDSDGLDDNLEINKYRTDPNKSDTDGDSLTDADEVNIYGTIPTNPDTDGDGVNDKDELTELRQEFNYALLAFPILSILVAGILCYLGNIYFIRPRRFVSNEEYLASRTKVQDEATQQTLEAIINSPDSRMPAGRISDIIRDSVSNAFGRNRLFVFGIKKKWHDNQIQAALDSIAAELDAEKDGNTLSFGFIGAFVPVRNELASKVEDLAEDWWGFVPMQIMQLDAVPELIYQGQHWSVHRLAPRLLQLVLAQRYKESEIQTKDYADFTRFPETGLNSQNIQHGYQFHRILEEYSKQETVQ